MNSIWIVWHDPLYESDSKRADHQALRELIYFASEVITGFSALEIRKSGCAETFDSFFITEVPAVVLICRPRVIFYGEVPDAATLFEDLIGLGCRQMTRVTISSVSVSRNFSNPQETAPTSQNAILPIGEGTGDDGLTDDGHSENSAISESVLQQQNDTGGPASSTGASQDISTDPSCISQAARSLLDAE